MRIGRTSGIGSGFGIARRTFARRIAPVVEAVRPGPEADRDREEVPGRALALRGPLVAEESRAERLARWHTHAPFLAQLIAARDDLAETRRPRRAEPAVALRAYGATMDGPGLLVPGYFVDVAR